LDLDETLIHYVEEDNNAFIQIRPYAEEFIENLYKHFEIVIFTAAMKDYADFVLDRFDLNKRIDYRLYREHTNQIDGVNIKDLSRLGRDMKRMIIIDNVEGNFKYQPQNGYHIKNFEGEEDDEELMYLQKELINMINHDPDDVREYINLLRTNMIQRDIDGIMK
jgi:CTD small phosphatase-like protein 2